MRFKVPEIFLGVVLSVAIFAMGMTFASSYYSHSSGQYEPQKSEAAAQKNLGGTLPALKDAKSNETHQQDESKGEFWSAKFTDWLLTILTGLLALFNYLLWKSTDKLWKAGERQLAAAQSSSERQLRAYVYLEKIPIKAFQESVTNLFKYTFKVDFRVKNFGQTPAHNAVVKYTLEVVDCVDKKPTQILDPNHTRQLGSIAPLTDFYDLDDAITGIDIAAIKDGRQAICLVGSITYDTAFAKSRVTNFRYLVGGYVGWHGDDEMSADDNGNDAT